MAETTPGFAGRVFRWLRIPISLLVLGLLIHFIDVSETLRVLSKADPLLIALYGATILLDRIVATWRWLTLVRLANDRVGFWDLFRLGMVSNFVGFFLPGTVGVEALRVYGLSRETSNAALAISSVFIERIMALLALAVLVILGLLLAPLDQVPDTVSILAWAVCLCLCIGILGLYSGPIRHIVLLPLRAAPLRRVRGVMLDIFAQIDQLRDRPGLIAGQFLLSILFQLLRVVGAVFGALALGIDAAFALFFVIIPITVLVTMIPISFGGLGVREASYVGLFALVGVNASDAFALAILNFLLVMAVLMMPGAFFYFRFGLWKAPKQAVD